MGFCLNFWFGKIGTHEICRFVENTDIRDFFWPVSKFYDDFLNFLESEMMIGASRINILTMQM